MAFVQRRPPTGVIFHTDRGCQYTSRDYAELARPTAWCSRSAAPGSAGTTPWPRSFFATIKRELIDTRPWPTRAGFAVRSSTTSRAGTTPADCTARSATSAPPPTKHHQPQRRPSGGMINRTNLSVKPGQAQTIRLPLRVPGPQIDPEGEDPVDELGLCVADHGEVREVSLCLLAKALALGALYRRHASCPDRLGTLPEPGHHLLRVERRHGGQRRGLLESHERRNNPSRSRLFAAGVAVRVRRRARGRRCGRVRGPAQPRRALGSARRSHSALSQPPPGAPVVRTRTAPPGTGPASRVSRSTGTRSWSASGSRRVRSESKSCGSGRRASPTHTARHGQTERKWLSDLVPGRGPARTHYNGRAVEVARTVWPAGAERQGADRV